MSFFNVRSRTPLTREQLLRIEQINVVDRTPQTPTTGVGYGTMLEVGEFEDGPFETPTEVFGASSEEQNFGGLGYTYGDLLHQNACARRRLGQDWNGNGFIKGKYLEPPRKIICRVDSSVGEVRFTLAASLRSNPAPFDMEPGDQLSVTTDTGGPAVSVAITATDATAAGAGFAPGPTGFVGGEAIGIQVDALPEVIVYFQAADQTAADVVARVNGFMGFICGVVNAGEIDLSSIQRGSGASITLRDVTAGALAAIGHAAGTTNGAGSVANVDSVTAAEAANEINSPAIGAINGVAVVDPLTNQVVVYRTGSAVGTVSVLDVAGNMATNMGFAVGVTVTANIGDAFDVPAGTRVRNAGGDEWVTMRTLSWPEGTAAAPNDGTQLVEVRDALDNGTGTGEIAGNVTTLVDLPSDRMIEVINPGNLSAALTPAQLDARYVTAIDATRPTTSAAREATVAICAYNSANVANAMRSNAIDASDEGNLGRIYVMAPALGTTLAGAIADVVNYRRDRVVYSWPGWQIYVNEIAEVGAGGGIGFSDDGLVDIGADGPLAYIMSVINPEENDCQDTGLLDFIIDIEQTTDELNKAAYEALKAAGICAARLDERGTFIYQSDVTTDLTPGRTTIKRRKMSDFIQDSLATASLPYAKKLATDSRRAGLEASYNSFLEGLLSPTNPQNQRINGYGVRDVTANNPDLEALGIFSYEVQVRMLPSMDDIVIDTQIGEGVVVTIDAAA
jgi:hypothetical protein